MSKFKVVATETLPEELLRYLDSMHFAERLLTEVLSEQLNITNATGRPAGHYVQALDSSIEVGGYRGLELTLSKVSVADGRNFGGALRVMQNILADVVKHYVRKGHEVQIFCVISTNAPVYGTSSTLFEMEDEVWVEGESAV